MKIDDAIWRSVIDGRYEVSNVGLIRNRENKHILCNRRDKDVYCTLHYLSNNKHKYVLVHRLIAQEFIPNDDNKLEVNHKNGIRCDNRVENLEWCTQSENSLHSLNTLHKWPNNKGERHGLSKLSEIQVLEIRDKYKQFVYSQYKLALEYDVSRSAIMHIVSGDRWGWLK